MELQHSGFYALRKWQNQEIRSPIYKSSYNISNDVHQVGQVILTIIRRSTPSAGMIRVTEESQ